MSDAIVANATATVSAEPLSADPYVGLLREHLEDPGLFSGGPQRARERQRQLLHPFLDFFLRHDRDDGFYRRLFRRKGLLDGAGEIRADVRLEDLVALRVHSDDLRGEDGQSRRLIREVGALRRSYPAYRSSGTTGNSDGPVTIVRSPMTLEMISRTFGRQIEWSTGFTLAGAAALMQGSLEMRGSVAMVDYICRAYEARGATVYLGARMRSDRSHLPIWRRLEPDVPALRAFYSSSAPRKVALIPPPALAELVGDEGLVRRISPDGAPFLDLGEGGVLMTGGGLKRLPEYDSLQDLLVDARRVFRSRVGGELVPAPTVDLFGLTESTTMFPAHAGDPTEDRVWPKFPHPLTWVGLLESPQRLQLVPDDEFGVPRLLFYVNFTCLDYLEAVVSGDLVSRLHTPDEPQHGLLYQRRAAEDEGFVIREGCG